ncbi:DUF3560 domain-containing protein, partial [Vibrio cortegadensis]|uniref:DUF3560 domain-containing protein n=1 Tax=Vibrio cortegadensis TaxID=1328770 RepID=UPI00352E3873
ATSVSPLEPSGSSKNDISGALPVKSTKKNEFLMSFKAGKLRKNAKKMIQKLLDHADTLTLKTQSMGLDDCWNANAPQAYDKADFWTWFDKNYSDMVIFLKLRDGILTKVEVCDCIYHFSNDLVMSFSLDEDAPTKPRFTFEQVSEALEEGFISPLNHDGKITPPTEPEPTKSGESLEQSETRKVVSLGDYQGRLEGKRERLEARADKAQSESERYYLASKERASHIPFGQPILVGHHSEKRARRDAERIFNDMGKSVKAQQKADNLNNRVESVGTAGIASDDPEAIQKLKSKLTSLERSQEMMKSINKVIRSNNLSEADKMEFMQVTHQLTQKQAHELLHPNFGSVGFADYSLRNNNATIRATKQRIKELEQLHNQKPFDEKGISEGFEWALYEEEGRIKFSFDDVPSEKIRTILKSNGFKWSRYSKAWVRKMTANAVYSTKSIVTRLNQL